MVSYIQKLPLTIRQGIKYGMVGLINTLTNLIVFETLIRLSINIAIANLTGYIVGITGSFIMNKKWTFKSNGSTKKEGILFLTIFGICYLVQLGVLLLINQKLNLQPIFAQIFAIGTFSICNFSLNKIFTFNKF